MEVPQALLLAFTFNALGTFYWTTVGLHIAPWRSLLVGLFIGIPLALAVVAIELSSISPLMVVGLSMFAAQTIEIWNHRTFVSKGALTVQYGFWGNRRESFPISEVRDVKVSYPLLGQIWNVGDIDVLGYGWGTTLPAVRRPEEYARRIGALAASVGKHGRAARATEGPL